MQSRQHKQINIEEKYLNEFKKITIIENTLADVVYKWWKNKTLSTMKPKDIYWSLRKALPQDRLEEPRVKTLLERLEQTDKVDYSISFIGNFIIRESEDGFIKHLINS